MTDHLSELAATARARVKRGYYDTGGLLNKNSTSLVKSIKENLRTPIIAEVKYASPSAGTIRKTESSVQIAKKMLNGGACGISVLTDPENFDGSLERLAEISQSTDAPTIMKDIIVSPKQLEAGKRAGATAVVLISEIFTRKLSIAPLDTMLLEAKRLGLETLIEANERSEFNGVLRLRPDLYGINNRNLSTFESDLSTTERILASNPDIDRPVISESGIESAYDVRRLKTAGAAAFLVGTSIMRSPDIERKVRELVNA